MRTVLLACIQNCFRTVRNRFKRNLSERKKQSLHIHPRHSCTCTSTCNFKIHSKKLYMSQKRTHTLQTCMRYVYVYTLYMYMYGHTHSQSTYALVHTHICKHNAGCPEGQCCQRRRFSQRDDVRVALNLTVR